MKKKIAITAGILVIFAVLIQFIPVTKTNPPVIKDITAPKLVKEIFRTSCYSCHSHETVWPWYSQIAPVSWLVAHDVSEARRKLNFSTWTFNSPEKETFSLEEALKEMQDGEMPPWIYVLAHPDARLSPDDLKTVEAYINARNKHS